MDQIPVIDVFAGPGGLNEGFSALKRDGKPVFKVVASFEMETNAVNTLRLRSAVRNVSVDGELYGPYRDFLAGRISRADLDADPTFAAAFSDAASHVHQIELGEENRGAVAEIIERATEGHDDWVLIGGPPCQAYSLVGRARRTHDETFEDDHKHFLYKEYLDILERFKPPVFVMENVKGLLSAGHKGLSMFDLIMRDLRMDGLYEVRSLVVGDEEPAPTSFVVHAENYGVPQARHRVILVGIKRGVDASELTPLVKASDMVSVQEAIGDLPKVESEASRSSAPREDWAKARVEAVKQQKAWLNKNGAGPEPGSREVGRAMPAHLREWYGTSVPVSLHEPRRHMVEDLVRYGFLAGVAEQGWRLTLPQLPSALLPNHRNVSNPNMPFPDRFKVQGWRQPSSTITSHISKDGHYYIHPDPEQQRSLTVREAARLQTFPDDYFFCGNRTAQYHQVGNAVPPLLAFKIAEKVAELLGR